MMRKLLLLASVALLGCGSTVESGQQIELWQALGIRNYSYTYKFECFCGSNGPNPARVTVQNGQVVSVTSTDPVPVPYTGSLSAYPTVEGLFAIVSQASAKNATTLNVTYDETYHFPRVIEIDYAKNTADDEVTYRAENFTPNGS